MMSVTPVAAARYPGLRGLTVRNTFLEFDEHSGDDFEASPGIVRQASEPAKAFNRQVSDQTTAGSGVTIEEGSMELEENLAHLHSHLAAVPQSNSAGNSRDGSMSPARNVCGGMPTELTSAADMHAAYQAAAGVGGMATFAPQAPCMGAAPMVRFCPHCGADAEPNHRFCPYCCYQLHAFQGGGSSGGGPGARSAPGPIIPQQQPKPPVAGNEVKAAPAMVVGTTGAPHLLTCLGRFRYVEANFVDVDYARTLSMHLATGGRAWGCAGPGS